MPASAEDGAWLTHLLDPNRLLTEPAWVLLLHIPQTTGTGHCQAPKLVCLQPYSLSRAEQHNPAVCMPQRCCTYRRCQGKYSCYGRSEVGSGCRRTGGRRRKGGGRNHCTMLRRMPESECCSAEATQTVFHRITKLLLSFSGTQSRCSLSP